MDSQNRIQTTNVAVTVGRQTPKRDFGDELVHVMGAGARVGAGVAGAALNGAPVVSAAVSGISGVVSGITSVTGQSAVGQTRSAYQVPASGVPAGAPESAPTGGSSAELLAEQREMNRESQAFSAMYLRMQSDMQQESREFNAVSNIIKVRHDSAKAAINNIR